VLPHACCVTCGMADVAFTIRQYVQTHLEGDRQVATILAELIIGGALVSTKIGTSQGAARAAARHYMQRALSLFEKGTLALVAGGGFEPPTSGL